MTPLAKKVATYAGIALLCLGPPASAPVRAADIDYPGLFKSKILKCIHPTVSAEKATVEIVNAPATKGDITTTRLKAFYPGLIKKDAMELDVLVRQAGSIRQMKVDVLSDSSVGGHCSLTKEWADF